jgi:hypothetical protein
VVALLAAASTASAAPATVGQLFPPTPGSCGGSPPFTYLQPAVASGNSYVVPVDGTITSWSFQAGADPVPGLKLKVGRPAGGNDFTIIGESAAPTVTASSLNNYSASIPVRTGDVIGMLESGGDCAASTGQTADKFALLAGDVAPSASPMTFMPGSGVRFPIQAVVTPAEPPPPPNDFTFGKLRRNFHRGTAVLPANVPGPGILSLRGNGVRAQRLGGASASKVVAAAGTVRLRIKATGRRLRTLNRTGKSKVRVSVTFTPTGGVPNTQSRRVTLIER